MTTKNIKCNFASVFAQFNTVEDIKEVANNICEQVKNAYESRLKELDSTMVEAVVEVEVEAMPVEETPKKESKKGDKKSRAKEMAEKFKKEKAETKAETKKETKTETKPKKEVRKETKAETSDLIAVTDTAAIKKLGLTFKKYNDKCYVLRGETKPLRKVLKDEFKGVYNSRLTGGEGWVISAKHAENCAKALGLRLGA